MTTQRAVPGIRIAPPAVSKTADDDDKPMDLDDYLYHCGGEDIIQLRTAADATALVHKLKLKYDKRDDIEIDIDLDALTVKIALYLPK